MFTCTESAHEWSIDAVETKDAGLSVAYTNAKTMANGHTIAVIKGLKAKWSSLVVKIGTRVKNILLVERDHGIDCRIPM